MDGSENSAEIYRRSANEALREGRRVLKVVIKDRKYHSFSELRNEVYRKVDPSLLNRKRSFMVEKQRTRSGAEGKRHIDLPQRMMIAAHQITLEILKEWKKSKSIEEDESGIRWVGGSRFLPVHWVLKG